MELGYGARVGRLADEQTIPGVAARVAHQEAAGATHEKPRNVALVGEDGAAMDFPTLWHRARLGAAALVERGVGEGDRVALLADSSPEWAVANLAILTAGATVVPLSTRWRDVEVEEILGRARCALVLREADLPIASPDGGSLHPPEETAASDASREVDRRLRALTPDAVSHVQFTSGTTGRPKGALLTHRGMVSTTQAWVRVVGLRRGDRYPIINPCSHIGGHKTGLLACLCAGATAYPIARFDPGRLRARLRADGFTFLQGPPAMFRGLLDAIDASVAEGEPAPDSVRVAVTGSANIPPALVVRMRETLRLDAVHAGYGLTEATGVCTITRADDPLALVTTTSGRPVPGVEVRIVDDRGSALPSPEHGEIQVRGTGVMRGYLDDPVATAEVIDAAGWLATGDIGYLDDRGNLAICDRRTDMVIVGGFNAYPAEIERVLTEHPAVAQAAVVGVPDDRLGEVPVAFVVRESAAGTGAGAGTAAGSATGSDEDAHADDGPDRLVAWARERLASYKVPRAIWVVDALPLTTVPKVDKVALAAEARRLTGRAAAR